jgi:hypothetical protein
MELNRSLAISSEIIEFKRGNILGIIEEEFPLEILDEYSIANNADGYGSSNIKPRHRVFTVPNTLLTMALTATQTDKSLKNSVQLYYGIHQQHKKETLRFLEEQKEKERESDEQKAKKAGRPKEYKVRLPSSLDKDISINTAAYSKARERVPLPLAEKLFLASRLTDAENHYTHWHGYRVLIGDGTYLQMQDSKVIRELYEVKYNGESSNGYPQALLEAVIERGTGQVYAYKLSNRHVSELELFYDILDQLPVKSILLLDDLYNCYEIIAKCKRLGIEIVVPDKKSRNYELIEVLEDGCEIVRINTPKNRSKWAKEREKPGPILLKRIQCKSPDGKEYVLLTTILDKTITSHELQELYLTRWDIEISIREVKTIMGINVLRSKTPEMALKELAVALATYNLIRKIIYASIKDLPFSPKEDFIFKFYTLNQELLVDKKGRVYNRWSTGRRRTEKADTQRNITKTKIQQKI